MDFINIVLLTSQITFVISRRHASSSDESIENLLYYKDCQRKKPVEVTPAPLPLRAPISPTPRAFECPYPKMCCSMTCNNECEGSPMIDRQAGPMGMNFRQPQLPVQMPVQPPTPRQRKKFGHQPPLLPPISSRRDFGFTKEKIKSLIAKDDDIRKILKDLVRVTMQKVDLVDMINSRRSDPEPPATPQNQEESVSDDELEMQ